MFANNPIFYSDPLGDTVKYDRFRDKVNSFFSRMFSSSYRDQFNTWKNSDEVYTIGKRAGSPSLISGGPLLPRIYDPPASADVAGSDL
ncbi:MAG: hypothetical protein ACO1NQ_02600 [Flavobacteriales bacterium]